MSSTTNQEEAVMKEKLLVKKIAVGHGHILSSWKKTEKDLWVSYNTHCKVCGRSAYIINPKDSDVLNVCPDDLKHPCIVPMWRLYLYDFWGDSVNSVYETNTVIPIPWHLDGDKLTEHLKKLDVIDHKTRPSHLSYDGDDTVIYINYKGYPESELVLEVPR